MFHFQYFFYCHFIFILILVDFGAKYDLGEIQIKQSKTILFSISYIFKQTDLFMTIVRLFSAADVHRPGPAGPKL